MHGVTNISHYQHWNRHTTLYKQLFITSGFYIRPSNTNTRNNDPIQNDSDNSNNDNSNDNNNHNNNNNNDFNKNSFKNNIFSFHNSAGVIAAQGILCHPLVRKGVIKLQHIISENKEAFISTAI